jgi:biotin carboxyl carrier protein
MKFHIKTRMGSRELEHTLDLAAGPMDSVDRAKFPYILDGEAGEFDWAEVSPGVYSLILNGVSYEVAVRRAENLAQSNGLYEVNVGADLFLVELQDPRTRRKGEASHAKSGPQEILAPMPGRIVKVLIAEGANVRKGQGLLVIEAMKMQNEVRAPRPGRVEKIYAQEGQGVESNVRLLRLV